MGASRKGFLGQLVDRPPLERDFATAATTAAAVAGGAAVVRVHDVAGNVDAARVADAIWRTTLPPDPP